MRTVPMDNRALLDAYFERSVLAPFMSSPSSGSNYRRTLSFAGDMLFSYSHPIAVCYHSSNSRTVFYLFNDDYRSNTTSNHLYLALTAYRRHAFPVPVCAGIVSFTSLRSCGINYGTMCLVDVYQDDRIHDAVHFALFDCHSQSLLLCVHENSRYRSTVCVLPGRYVSARDAVCSMFPDLIPSLDGDRPRFFSGCLLVPTNGFMYVMSGRADSIKRSTVHKRGHSGLSGGTVLSLRNYHYCSCYPGRPVVCAR